MAARDHSTANRYSMGTLTLNKIVFTDIDNGDTYESGIIEPVAWWANATDDPTINLEGVKARYQQSATGADIGTFTFYAAEDNRAVELYVLSRT